MRGGEKIKECNDCGRCLPISKFEKDGRRNCKKCRNIRFRYKISGRQFYQMLEYQEYCCLICEDAINEKTAAIDHCHDSGNVRGLLCNGCNSGIGMLKHNKEFAYRAFEYLRYFK